MEEQKQALSRLDTKRVFVLGSGFSAAVGLPTLRNLFSEIMARPDRPGESDREEVLAALVHLYPHFSPASPRPSFPPFEEFLSLVVAAEPFTRYPTGYWHRKRLSSLRLLTDCLGDLATEAEGRQPIAEFVIGLRPGDVVITFNWDNLVERPLLQQKRRLHLLQRDPEGVTVLKLHGSMTWGLIPPGKRLVDPKTVLWLTDNVVSTPDFGRYDLWDALNEPPFIVPPILTKQPLAEPFLRRLWDEAFGALMDAMTVTVIGYSCPPDDFQARTLLSTSLNERARLGHRYRLIDPDPSVAARYFSQICPALDYVQSNFSSGLIPN